MTSFTITPVEKGIFRCRHTGPLSHEEVRALTSFMYDYRGKLLIDLSMTTGEECMRNVKQLRPMMPTTAIFGAKIDQSMLDIPESYCIHDVRCFETEEKALSWLRNQY